MILAGPDPRALIEPVPPSALKAEARETLDRRRSGQSPTADHDLSADWVPRKCSAIAY